MRSAASRPTAGITWLSTFIVIAKVEWPSISMTTRGWTPWARSKVAAVCRRSWKRRRRRPATSNTRCNSVVTFLESMAVDGCEERPRLLDIETLHLVPSDTGRVHESSDIAARDAPLLGRTERAAEDGVNVLDGACRQPRLELRGEQRIDLVRGKGRDRERGGSSQA